MADNHKISNLVYSRPIGANLFNVIAPISRVSLSRKVDNDNSEIGASVFHNVNSEYSINKIIDDIDLTSLKSETESSGTITEEMSEQNSTLRDKLMEKELLPPPEGATLIQMLDAIWPNSGMLAKPDGTRLVCSINKNLSGYNCEFCNNATALKDKILLAANWLSGHHNKTPKNINYTESHNYSNFIDELMDVMTLAKPYLPPTTPEEIELFKQNHTNVTVESQPTNDPSEELLGILPEVKRSGKRFYFNYEGAHLTYAFHFEAEPYIKFIENKLKARKDASQLSYYSIVNETGSTGHKHTHVSLLFNRKVRHESEKFFDYIDPTNTVDKVLSHPNIQPITSKKNDQTGKFQSHFSYFANTVIYHRKQGTPVTNVTDEDLKELQAGEKLKPSTFNRLNFEQVSSAGSKKELINMCKENKVDPRDVPKLVTSHAIIRQHTSEVVLKEITSLNEIQEFIIEYLNFENDRTIVWVADPKGRIGKSYVSSLMRVKHNAYIITSTNCDNSVRALKNEIDDNGQPRTIIVDLARSALTSKTEDYVYTMLETLKSQEITSGKYDSKAIRQEKSPNILVMSNGFPDVKRLTDDRWVVLVSGMIPNTFDYVFAGTSGKLSLEVYNEYYEELKQVAIEELAPLPKGAMPVKHIADITNYPSKNYLSMEYRMSCWDKGMFPIFKVEFHPPTTSDPNGKTLVTVELEPLSDEEKKGYEEWKSNINNTNCSDPILLDMARHLRKQKDSKVLAYRTRIREQKQLNITPIS